MLERMRDAVKDRMKPKLAKDSFILKPFEICRQSVDGLGEALFYESPIETYYKKKVEENSLASNHFVSLKDVYQYKGELEPVPEADDDVTSDEGPQKPTFLEPTLMNGYDGLGGAHDNIIWLKHSGQYVYTLNNKLIFEDTKSRAQKIFTVTTVRLSCISCSVDDKFLAVGEGEPSEEGYACIHYFQMGETPIYQHKLKLHKKGIQSIGMFNKPKAS